MSQARLRDLAVLAIEGSKGLSIDAVLLGFVLFCFNLRQEIDDYDCSSVA